MQKIKSRNIKTPEQVDRQLGEVVSDNVAQRVALNLKKKKVRC